MRAKDMSRPRVLWALELADVLTNMSPGWAQITSEILKGTASELNINLQKFGLVRTLLLYTVYLQAHLIVRRIRKHVLPERGDAEPSGRDTSEEALVIKASYTANLNMIAVAVS